ncbi:hypothetical protein MRB53_019791 [Persea americana]|uniref:Uncharacterized protein n=1 Tax=Persea americana TaxID=3435 RepID=A0ACC2KZ25_PERAE|nr:hypothetical protein MRB53_019791 [Persea americana]
MAALGWWRLISAALTGILYFHSFCFSDQAPNYSFMQPATKAQAVSYYDYIIIGGGTAGCPLAATLSLNSKVLLLERGDSPYGNPNISNLINFGDTLFDLSPTSPSQRFISEDGVINARARVLGGGSCLNAGFYTRASPSYVRASGWDGRLVNSSYEWVERLVAFEPRVLQWQSAVRDGLVEVGVQPYNGFTYDHIYGTKVGGSIFDKDGHRHTAADLLKYANPSGLTVLLHATVHRILFRTAGKAKPLAHGVIFRDGKGGVHRAYLNKGSKNEIIVSAGAIGSPQLLMLSGIGPARQLQKLGIKVTVDQPLVGQGMSDNPMNALYIPSPLPVEVSLIQTGQISTVPPKQRTPEAIEKAVKAMNSLEVESFRGGFILEKALINMTSHFPVNLRPRHENDSTSLEQFCKDTVMTIWHYHGGCQAGRVVDHDYRVLGVDALRVIDGSTFNYSPGANPQATVMMLGS